MIKKIAFILAVFVLMTLTASAAIEPSAKIITYYTNVDVDDINETTEWIIYESNIIDVGDSITSLRDIDLNEVTNDGTKAFFEIEGDELIIAVGDFEVIEDFKIELIDIDDYDVADKEDVADKDEDVVDVWIEPSTGSKLYLAANGENKFNMAKYGSDSGWETSYEDNEITFKAERLQNVKINADMDTDGGSFVKEEVDDEIMIYTLKENGEYTFTIEYEKESVWGGIEDETEVYTIILTGLDEVATTDYSDEFGEAEKLFDTEIDGKVGDTKTFTTPVDGEFALGTGVSETNKVVNDDGTVLWTFKLNSITTAECQFKEFEDEGNDFGNLTFIITAKPTPTPPPTTTTTTNNNNNNNNVNSNQGFYDDLGENKNLIGVLVLIIGCIVGGAFLMNNKKKGGKGGNTMTSIPSNDSNEL